MNRILTTILVLILTTGLFMAACAAPPPPSPTPPRAPGQAFLMIIERVQNLAQTYEAKEYVALLFPPLSKNSEYDVELRAWVMTITTFPPEAREGFERVEWFWEEAFHDLDNENWGYLIDRGIPAHIVEHPIFAG